MIAVGVFVVVVVLGILVYRYARKLNSSPVSDEELPQSPFLKPATRQTATSPPKTSVKPTQKLVKKKRRGSQGRRRK
jgi:hypothetical protein